MGTFKHFTVQFLSPDRRSWSERYYYSNAGATLDTVAGKAKTLLRLRTRMLGLGPSIYHAFCSDDDFTSDVALVDIPIVAGTPPIWNKDLILGPDEDDAMDYSWSTLLLRMTSGTRATKHSYLSGVPDGLTVNKTPFKVDSAPFQKAYDLWVKELQTSWAWKGYDQDDGTNPGKPITMIKAVGGQMSFTTGVPHGLVVGETVKVVNTKNLNGKANGLQKVTTVTDATTFITDRTAGATYSYLGGGKVYKRVFKLYGIEDVKQVRFTNRKRGGSIGLIRGRARTQRS